MGASKSKRLPPGFELNEEFDQREIKEYQKVFNEGGLSGLKNKIDEDINKWRNVPVNIAITGNSGVGKSSFINSFRGLKAEDRGAAAVGFNETTRKPQMFLHPKNENIALWELSGIGTQNFPKECYLKYVGFEIYDYFLIVTANRFTENDLWLANEVRKRGKKFFFIRTKLDQEVKNYQYDHPSTTSTATVNKIKKEMTTQVETGGFKGVEIYLISNHFTCAYDFPILMDTMIERAPKLKREAMTLTLTNLTEDLIMRKRDALRKRIMIVAICSGFGGAIPIPGLSLAVDLGLIMFECQFFKDQFGLDDDSLNKKARVLGIPVDEIKSKAKVSCHLVGTSVKSIAAFVENFVISEVDETITAIALPIAGSFIGGTISYGNTVAVLRSILNEFVKESLVINKMLMDQLSNKTTDSSLQMKLIKQYFEGLEINIHVLY